MTSLPTDYWELRESVTQQPLTAVLAVVNNGGGEGLRFLPRRENPPPTLTVWATPLSHHTRSPFSLGESRGGGPSCLYDVTAAAALLLLWLEVPVSQC